MASEFQASGVAQLWFVPVIADLDAPTAAAIAAGEYLNCELIGFEGFPLSRPISKIRAAARRSSARSPGSQTWVSPSLISNFTTVVSRPRIRC